MMERISGSVSWSADKVVIVTWISARHCLGSRGRMGRSVSREVSVAFSVGRPSRLMKPPGILPAAYIFSS